MAPIVGLTRHWRVVAAVPIAFAIVGAVFTAVTGEKYVAESRFAPYSQESRLSNLAGIAAQFGISVGSTSDGESVEFYAQLLRSRELLQGAVVSGYERGQEPRLDTAGALPTLLELWRIKGKTRDEQLLNGVRRLRAALRVNMDLRANLVTVQTEAGSAWLAEELNRRLLDLVNQFNLQKRQSHASAQRRFVETRMNAARQELLAAEDSLQRFLTKNRSYEQSPTLRFEAGRLERVVDLRQQVYTSLAQSFEQARIDEVRNTPVINIVDAPEGSAEQHGGIVRSALIGFLLGIVVAVVLALSLELWERHRRTQPTDYEVLIDHMRQAAREMRSVKMWFRLPRQG